MNFAKDYEEDDWDDKIINLESKTTDCMKNMQTMQKMWKDAQSELDAEHKKRGILRIRTSASGTVHGDLEVAPPYVAHPINTQPDKENPVDL